MCHHDDHDNQLRPIRIRPANLDPLAGCRYYYMHSVAYGGCKEPANLGCDQTPDHCGFQMNHTGGGLEQARIVSLVIDGLDLWSRWIGRTNNAGIRDRLLVIKKSVEPPPSYATSFTPHVTLSYNLTPCSQHLAQQGPVQRQLGVCGPRHRAQPAARGHPVPPRRRMEPKHAGGGAVVELCVPVSEQTEVAQPHLYTCIHRLCNVT